MLRIGDDVEVALDSVEDGFGETRLSRERAKRVRTWESLEDAFEHQKIVKGVINGRVKGGYTVDVGFVRAFLPGSLVDVRPVRGEAVERAACGVAGAIVEDYGKGTLAPAAVRTILRGLRAVRVPVAVDPKQDLRPYRGVELIKPNLREAEALAGMRIGVDAETLDRLRRNLLEAG